MFKWLKKTALWIVAVPLLATYLGAGLNQVVIAANHDKFPVTINDARLYEYQNQLVEACQGAQEIDPEAGDRACQEAQMRATMLEHGYLDDIHVIATKQTRLNWLADWIDIHGDIYSPGDLILFLGEFGMQYALLVWVVVVIGKLSRKED